MNSVKTDEKINENVICGRNSVLEVLRSGRETDCILMAKGDRNGSLLKIVAMAGEMGIPVKEVSAKKLDFVCGTNSHQGVCACLAFADYCSVDDIFKNAESKNQSPFIIICDGIEDPHNLGAIIRTAETAGAHGVIIPKRRSASLTAVVAKTACGALEYVPVARVSNLNSTIDDLKKRGVWIYAADMDGEDYRKPDFSGAKALVVGSEGNGVSRLVREKCDFIVSLPMRGKISSLNASVAAGILMYRMTDCDD